MLLHSLCQPTVTAAGTAKVLRFLLDPLIGINQVETIDPPRLGQERNRNEGNGLDAEQPCMKPDSCHQRMHPEFYAEIIQFPGGAGHLAVTGHGALSHFSVGPLLYEPRI